MGPLIISKAVKVMLRVCWSQRGCLGVKKGSRGGSPGGPMGQRGMSRGSHGTNGLV